jgi:hypothetical protein
MRKHIHFGEGGIMQRPVTDQARLSRDIKRVLENPILVPEIQSGIMYSRVHDDHDGEFTGNISTIMGPDGDMHIIADTVQPLRFRNDFGGGCSLRVHNALKILALAIMLDNKNRPQKR